MGAGPKDKWARNWVKGEPKIYKTADVEKFDCIDFVINLNNLYSAEQLSMWGKFDVVFCLETLEHVWNPIQAIKNLSKLTKDNGVLYTSTPFINPIHDRHDYLRYTWQWFEKVLPIYGFREVKTEPRVATYQEELMDFYKREGQRMSKVTLKRYGGRHYFDVGYMIGARKCQN